MKMMINYFYSNNSILHFHNNKKNFEITTVNTKIFLVFHNIYFFETIIHQKNIIKTKNYYTLF